MSNAINGKGIVEYYYFPKNKFPHQVAFMPHITSSFTFNNNYSQTVVIPWLRECIGEYGDAWENVYDYDYTTVLNAGTQKRIPYYPAFNFLNKEDAVLFRLTWG